MTKEEFFKSAPGLIEHTSWGFGNLEITAESKNNKGVCYRHNDNTASGGTYGTSWDEVYSKLLNYIKNNTQLIR